ncbi:hypothetical protein [Nocardioides sp. GXZ039]|uniref:hypothetical protein n=1 Tax=Nocardioides sp. GXZ039 TaxID=3136018 RepID=UPI0030F38D6F
MHRNASRPAPSTTSVLLQELAQAERQDAEREQVVFVTNAVRRRGGLRTRAESHRPVLAVVIR